MSDYETQHHEPEVHIDDLDDGKYALYVDGTKVLHVGPTYANPLHRDIHFSIYGPVDHAKAVAIMKGFLQLTVLMGGAAQVPVRRPAIPESDDTPPKETRKWQTSRTIRKSRPS